jgi:hypothetical protein
MEYPDVVQREGFLKEFVSKRGCLMGLPLSWFILSLVNLWAAETSCRLAIGDRKGVEDYFRLAICGDDLVSIMPKLAQWHYQNLITRVGSGLSAGKHLESDRLLMFTEQACVLDLVQERAPLNTIAGRIGQTLTSLKAHHMVDAMPLKSLVYPSHFSGMHSALNSELPTWAVSGPAISSAIPAWSSERVRKTVYLLSKALRPEFRLLRDLGIPPTLPRELGGGGFPGPTPDYGFRKATQTWKRAITLAVLTGKGDWARKLTNMWRVCGVAGDSVAECLEMAKEDVPAYVFAEAPSMSRVDARNATIRGHKVLFERDLILRIASLWAPVTAIAGFHSPRKYCLKLHKFVALIKKHIRSVGLLPAHLSQFKSSDSDIVSRFQALEQGRALVVPSEKLPPAMSVNILGTRQVRELPVGKARKRLASHRFVE